MECGDVPVSQPEVAFPANTSTCRENDQMPQNSAATMDASETAASQGNCSNPAETPAKVDVTSLKHQSTTGTVGSPGSDKPQPTIPAASDITAECERQPEAGTETDQPTPDQGEKSEKDVGPREGEEQRVASSSEEWDQTSELSLFQLTFIVGNFLPAWNPWVNGSHWDATRKCLKDEYSKYGGKQAVEVELCGGLFDGLCLPPVFNNSSGQSPNMEPLSQSFITSNTAVKVIARKNKVFPVFQKRPAKLDSKLFRFYTSYKECHPGFLHVHPTDDNKTGRFIIVKESKGYLSSSLLRESFENGETYALGEGFGEDTLDSATEHTATVPSHTTTVALYCPLWPKQANAWKTRSRPSGWPTQEMCDNIAAKGCLVSPTSHPGSEWKEVEWMFDFSIAERTLASLLTLPQRQCFMLLQALAKVHLQAPQAEINSILRTILFWSLEKIPVDYWQDNRTALARCFFYMLDELHQCLAKGNIPHYFLPENNIIDHISNDVISELKNRVLQIRQEPLKFLFIFDKQFKFPFSTKEDYETLMGALLDDLKLLRENMSQTEVLQILTMDDLITCYLEEENPAAAAAVTENMAAALENTFKRPFSVTEILHSKILNKLPLANSVLAFEYLLDNFEPEGSVISNAACQYTALSCTEPPGPRRDQLAEKAEKTFKKAIYDSPHYRSRVAGMADYGVFLLAFNRYEEAIPVMLEVLEKHREQSTWFSNSYEENEKCTVDDNLQREIEARGGISSPSVLLAYYQLVKCYLMFNWVSEAKELMNEYQEACISYFVVSKEPQCLSLLAYSYMATGDYFRAFNLSVKVLEIDPTYNLAKDNMKTCAANNNIRLGQSK